MLELGSADQDQRLPARAHHQPTLQLVTTARDQGRKIDRMNEAPCFDQSVLDLLKAELGAEDTAQVLRTFLTDAERRIRVCAVSISDRVVLKREAHSLKSSSATFGFTELSELALAIERDAAGIGDDELRGAVDALQEVFGRTSSLARSIVSGLEAEARS